MGTTDGIRKSQARFDEIKRHIDLAEQLRQSIKRFEGTEYALAKAAGIPQITVSRFVNGERDLKLDTADKLAAALGLELSARKPDRRVGTGRRRGNQRPIEADNRSGKRRDV